MRDDDRDRQASAIRFTRRGLVLGLGQAAVFGGLASRLYQVQVLEGSTIATRAEDNRTRHQRRKREDMHQTNAVGVLPDEHHHEGDVEERIRRKGQEGEYKVRAEMGTV